MRRIRSNHAKSRSTFHGGGNAGVRGLRARAPSTRAWVEISLTPKSFEEFFVERVAVVRPVTDDGRRRGFGKAFFEGVDNDLGFMALTTSNPGGHRKTIAVCRCP